MGSLIYLIAKSVKNSLREMLKNPAKLILYLFVVFGIVVAAVGSIFSEASMKSPLPLFWFTGIFFAFSTMFVIISVLKGLSSGDTIFEMNDVNLLFVSPVNPRKILLYGILRLTKVAFLAGFFILFQSTTLSNFGIRFGGVLLTMLVFMVNIVVLSFISLIIYNLTNSRPRRKLFAKLLTFFAFLPLLIFLAVRLVAVQNPVAALEAAIQSPFLIFIPVSGWSAAGLSHLLAGELARGFLFLGANVVLGIGLVAYILLSNPDYYEDTLVATETAFEKKRAAAEGNLNAAQNTRKSVKVGNTGIQGSGASALFGKHLRESFRENRFGFLTLASVIIIAGAVMVSYFAKDLIMTMQILMWTQIFLIGTGRGLRETYTHYIYLIPDTSFRKILWSNMEVVVKTLLESVLIFGVGGVLIRANVLIIAGTIAAYALFSLLLLGVNYLSMRFLGANISTGLLIMIYYLAVVIAVAPGVILAMIIGFMVGGVPGAAIGLGILAAWELAAGLACFAAAQGVLHHCDMPVVRPRG